jgi:A-factor biosynthesis hotdog protein
MVVNTTLPEHLTSTVTRSTAELHVDQRHPFFFDHTLDHVSGMLLLTALLDLARSSDGHGFDSAAGRRIRLDVAFTRICELDSPVALFAYHETGLGTHVIRAVQGDHDVCEGGVELIDDTTPTVSGHDPSGDIVVPVAAEAVRRQNPGNVLLGEPTIVDGAYRAPIIGPPAGHFLLRRGDDRYCVEELVECGRQLATIAGQGPQGKPTDTQLIWNGLTADLPVALSRRVPLELCWPITRQQGNNADFRFTLAVRGTGQVLGTSRYVGKICSPAAYRRLRQQWSA